MDKEKFRENVKKELITIAKEYNCEYKIQRIKVNLISIKNMNKTTFFYSCPITIEDKDFIVEIEKLNYKFIVENSIIQSVIQTINDRYELYELKNIFNSSLSYKINSVNIIIERYLNNMVANSISIIQDLSISKYESSACNGCLCFLDSDNSSFIKLDENSYIEFNKYNIKMIRKLLSATNHNEMILNVEKSSSANTGSALYVNGFNSLENISQKRKNCIIEFIRPGYWKMFYLTNKKKKKHIIEYRDGKYYELSSKKENDKKSKEKIKNFLNKNFEIIEINNLGKLIEQVRNYGHGAIIIITDDDEYISKMQELDRSTKARYINEKLFNKEKIPKGKNNKFIISISHLCDIDGAIFFNKNGELESFGTILDGIACSKGDKSRGSRYNSTKTFIESKIKENESKDNKKKYIAIVISEDGPINVFTTDDKIKKEDKI